MNRPISFTLSAFAVAGAVCAFSQFTIAQDTDQRPKPVTPRLKQRLQQEAQKFNQAVEQRFRVERDMTLLNDVGFPAVKNVNLGKYWIGLTCAPVSPALRSQLQLADGQGLLVNGVPEDSPARKAGLKAHDVIVKAGDSPVGSVEDLIKAVQKAKTADLTLELLRRGESTTVTVKPAERPVEQQGLIVGIPELAGKATWLHSPRHGIAVFEPGIVIDRPVNPFRMRNALPRLPNGLSITITRRGGNPTEIHVERQGNKWDVSESEIDQLPEEIRPHVRSLLNPTTAEIYSLPANNLPKYRFTKPQQPTPLPPHSTQPDAGVPPESIKSELEKLRKELSKEVKQLHDKIDKLQKSAAKNSQ